MWCRENICVWRKYVYIYIWICICIRMKVDSFLSPCRSKALMWGSNLEAAREEYFQNISIGKGFLKSTSETQDQTQRVEKWSYMKLKGFWAARGWSAECRDSLQDRRETFPNSGLHLGHKGTVKINSILASHHEVNSELIRCTDSSQRRTTVMVNKYLRRSSNSLAAN